MLQSMTGFGQGSAENAELRIDVEMRSVNSRFLDLVLRLPKGYGSIEQKIREGVTSEVKRGRVEVSVKREVLSAGGVRVEFNQGLFEALLGVYKKVGVGVGFGLNWPEAAALDILRRQEILDVSEGLIDPGAELKLVQQAVAGALSELCSMRRFEGARLADDLTQKLAGIEEILQKMEVNAADTPVKFRGKLLERIELLEPSVKMDLERLAQEVALLADRVDISEELVRVRSHCAQFRKALAEAGSGRRLEFLLQELGREFNTSGSKCQDAEIQTLVVDAKAELEKLREQVLNIE